MLGTLLMVCITIEYCLTHFLCLRFVWGSVFEGVCVYVCVCVCRAFRCSCDVGCTMVVMLCVLPAPPDLRQRTRSAVTGTRTLSLSGRCATSPGQPSCVMSCTALAILRRRRRRKRLRRRCVEIHTSDKCVRSRRCPGEWECSSLCSRSW